MTALVILSSALICFQGKCHHALVGDDTPIGVFSIKHELTEKRGYGGDILVFKETDEYVYAIHRVWLGNPKQHRLEKLEGDNPNDRRSVTLGCINVEPEVYKQLVDNNLTELDIKE